MFITSMYAVGRIVRRKPEELAASGRGHSAAASSEERTNIVCIAVVRPTSDIYISTQIVTPHTLATKLCFLRSDRRSCLQDALFCSKLKIL